MSTPTQPGTIVDLFAGPGGWSEGLRMLGLSDIGVEWDRDACLTRAAAGHLTVRADVAQYPPEAFAGAWGLIASPPCPDWSIAGSGKGRDGASGWLVDVPPTWVRALRPIWIACEQVPLALPVWREHAELYRSLGYSVWTGVLNAADFGVPQVRRRAILLASLDRAALPPEPTHAASPSAGLFGDRAPHVTMASAIGWGLTQRPALTLTTGGADTGGVDPLLAGGSGARRSYREAASHAWCWQRPATTVCASDRLSWPGHHTPEKRSHAIDLGAEALTLPEALTLQSFPSDHPVAGGKASTFRQVGNAVPPLFAAHLLSAVTGHPAPSLGLVGEAV